MQQLQEQLQLNFIQQTHIFQSADKKKSGSLQQLALQQQQLIQQLQMMQRQYVVHQGMGIQPLMVAQSQGMIRSRLQEVLRRINWKMFSQFQLIISIFKYVNIKFINNYFLILIVDNDMILLMHVKYSPTKIVWNSQISLIVFGTNQNDRRIIRRLDSWRVPARYVVPDPVCPFTLV